MVQVGTRTNKVSIITECTSEKLYKLFYDYKWRKTVFRDILVGLLIGYERFC